MPEFDSTIEYRPLREHPQYAIGNDGSAWSNFSGEWRELKGNRPAGYRAITIGSATRYIHRLVLELFIGPCPDGMVCCHDPDPDPTNNHVSNLRWDTQRENAKDASRHGRRKLVPGGKKASRLRTFEERRQQGLCVMCGLARHPGSKAYCTVHLEKLREAARRKIGYQGKKTGRPPLHRL